MLQAELNRNGSADLTPVDTLALPNLDVVVAARDEEGVVTRLVERLTSLRYPADRLTTWVIDDGSQDRTLSCWTSWPNTIAFGSSIVSATRVRANRGLSTQPWRSSLANGWFSMPMPSLGRSAGTLGPGWWLVGGAAAQGGDRADRNWLTRAQAMEMALDAVIQTGRLAGGGVAELQGNGQLIRRSSSSAVVVSMKTPSP